MLAAIVVYGIGHHLPAVYTASGTLRVATATQSGIADSNVTAQNDLASQYAQLVGSSSVVAMAAKTLGVRPARSAERSTAARSARRTSSRSR